MDLFVSLLIFELFVAQCTLVKQRYLTYLKVVTYIKPFRSLIIGNSFAVLNIAKNINAIKINNKKHFTLIVSEL